MKPPYDYVISSEYQDEVFASELNDRLLDLYEENQSKRKKFSKNERGTLNVVNKDVKSPNFSTSGSRCTSLKIPPLNHQKKVNPHHFPQFEDQKDKESQSKTLFSNLFCTKPLQDSQKPPRTIKGTPIKIANKKRMKFIMKNLHLQKPK